MIFKEQRNLTACGSESGAVQTQQPPTLTERLRRRELLLTEELENVRQARIAIESSPQVQTALDALAKLNL